MNRTILALLIVPILLLFSFAVELAVGEEVGSGAWASGVGLATLVVSMTLFFRWLRHLQPSDLR